MDNLRNLEVSFKPKRLFECKHTKIEVDAVFVRIPEDTDNEDWKIVDGSNGERLAEIRVENILQDSAAIRSARVSTDRDTLAVNDKAQGLIQYLWWHYVPSKTHDSHSLCSTIIQVICCI